jgi:hypothetical protein
MTEPPEVPRVEAEQLAIVRELGDGGQGTVFLAAIPHAAVPLGAYKEYRPEVRPEVDWSNLESLIRVHRDAAGLVEDMAWPTAIVTRAGQPTGFLMRLAPPDCTVSLRIGGVARQQLLALEYLLNPPDYMAMIGLAVTEQERVGLLRDLAAMTERLHGAGIVIGDLSPKNVVASLRPRPRCFLLDCDAVRRDGLSVLRQVETPDWELPTGEELATAAGDSYKLALCVLRVLAGDQSSRDPSLVPGHFGELAARVAHTLLAAPPDRPSASEWLAFLDRAAPLARSVVPAPPPPPRSVPQLVPTPPHGAPYPSGPAPQPFVPQPLVPQPVPVPQLPAVRQWPSPAVGYAPPVMDRSSAPPALVAGWTAPGRRRSPWLAVAGAVWWLVRGLFVGGWRVVRFLGAVVGWMILILVVLGLIVGGVYLLLVGAFPSLGDSLGVHAATAPQSIVDSQSGAGP